MKAEYNRLFDKITSDLSDRELLDMALRKAENMEKTTKKSVRKPIIAACAAAAVLAAGTIGVGAALDWDFNSLFGTRIVAETEQLGQELLGEAQNAVVSCDSDIYDLRLNGVTGTASSVLASIEISRKDGAPITEYPRIGDIDTPVLINENGETVDISGDIGMSTGIESTDRGTMILTCTLTSLNSNDTMEILADKRIRMQFKDIFNIGAIEFTAEFTYIPSEKAMDSLSGYDLSAPCSILHTVYPQGDMNQMTIDQVMGVAPEDRIAEVDATISSISIRSDGGVISGKLHADEYSLENHIYNTFMCDNDVKLIRKDGSEIPVSFGGHSISNNDGDFKVDLCYSERAGMVEKAVDISTIEAISINGTVYPLS